MSAHPVAATGGDSSGAALSGQLGNGSVTIMSTAGTHSGSTDLGDINVNDTVSWNRRSIDTY